MGDLIRLTLSSIVRSISDSAVSVSPALKTVATQIVGVSTSASGVDCVSDSRTRLLELPLETSTNRTLTPR